MDRMVVERSLGKPSSDPSAFKTASMANRRAVLVHDHPAFQHTDLQKVKDSREVDYIPFQISQREKETRRNRRREMDSSIGTHGCWEDVKSRTLVTRGG